MFDDVKEEGWRQLEKWKIDVPVYMIFFNRPAVLKQVFAAVRHARPSKLFLACDGARDKRPDDIVNIRKCQKIVENIDWECEVHRNYSKENLGCGMRMYTGINWAFEYVDRLMILEDDCVPSQDFFPFCQELLERYKSDDRIFMINGMNHLGKYDATPNSYFFGPACCWGWATWKRAWKNMDFGLNFMEDKYSLKCIEDKYPYYKNIVERGERHLAVLRSGKKLSTWTFQSGMALALQSQMAIIPSVNLITNVGLTEDSGHAVNSLRKVAKRQQAYFFAPFVKMQFPLKHPKYVVEDFGYYEKVQKKFKATFFSKMEGYIRRIIFADKGDIGRMIKKIPEKLMNHIKK